MDGKGIHRRLKEFRKHKNMKATEMAEVLGKSASGYGAYEQGKNNFPMVEAIFLFNMGCNLNWLIAGEGPMEWDEKIVPPSENEVIKSQAKSLELLAKSIENLSKNKTVKCSNIDCNLLEISQ